MGAKATLDQMEGGNEVYESYIVARNLSRPVESATDAGRHLYRTQAAKAQAKRIKKIQAGKKIGKKAATGEAAGIAMDRKDVKNSTRRFIVQHYMQDYPKEKIRKLSGILALDRN